MSDPLLSDIGFNNKMRLVGTTLKTTCQCSLVQFEEAFKMVPTSACQKLNGKPNKHFRLASWWISLAAFFTLTWRVWFIEAVGLYHGHHFFLEWIAKWKLHYQMLKSLHYDHSLSWRRPQFVRMILIETKVLYKNNPANKKIFVV